MFNQDQSGPKKPKVAYIVGPTASGKTSLALQIGQKYSGEIVCADSQTLRRDLNIGTAKPTKQQRETVKHHLLDIIGLFDDFSVADFQKMAQTTIQQIQQRGKLPIIVGGSGLYIDSLYYDYQLAIQDNSVSSQELEKKSLAELQKIIQENDYPMPNNFQNRRHLIGVIKRSGQSPNDRHSEVSNQQLIIGLWPEVSILRQRIKDRIQEMINDGLVEEVRDLLEKYPTSASGRRLDAIGYGLVQDYLEGKFDLSELKERLFYSTWKYARRQRSWFKRNSDINWFSDPESAYQFFVNNF